MALVAGSGPVWAEGWALRAGDDALTEADARALTANRTLTFYDDGQARYLADGRYAWIYSEANGGGTATGHFTVRDDGAVCVALDNGRSRCDLYVRSAGRLVLITETGGRFPVRP